MKMILLFSHTLTPEQKEDAEKTLKVDEFISLPDELQNLWSNVPPEIENLDNYLEPIFNYLRKNLKKGDFVLVQGDFGVTCKTAEFVKSLEAVAVYATTKREVIEKKENDKIVKISIFKHIRFRKF